MAAESVTRTTEFDPETSHCLRSGRAVDPSATARPTRTGPPTGIPDALRRVGEQPG